MTFEQLRIFVAVAERQHVTRAAEALNLAQSAASAAIAALEAQYGVKFFHRVGRGIELTEVGRSFLPEARAVIARAEAAELALSDLAGLERGTLLIRASHTIASYWLPRHIVAFRRAHPGVDIKLTIGNSAQVAAAVRDGLADLGFVEGAIDDTDLASVEVARDQLVIVVGMDHPWAGRDPVRIKDLTAVEWVMREPGSGTRSAFEDSLERMGVRLDDLHIIQEFPSNEAVRAAVEAGMGATALSASAIVAGLEAGLLHRIAIDLPDRSFHALRHRQRHRSLAADALMELIAGSGSGAGTCPVSKDDKLRSRNGT